jgi:hypothetical protein
MGGQIFTLGQEKFELRLTIRRINSDIVACREILRAQTTSWTRFGPLPSDMSICTGPNRNLSQSRLVCAIIQLARNKKKEKNECEHKIENFLLFSLVQQKSTFEPFAKRNNSNLQLSFYLTIATHIILEELLQNSHASISNIKKSSEDVLMN